MTWVLLEFMQPIGDPHPFSDKPQAKFLGDGLRDRFGGTSRIETDMEKLAGNVMRVLKGRAQLLEATVMVGKQGVGPEFYATLDDALNRCEMVKVKFVQFKDERKTLARAIAEKSGSHLIQQVGHVAVFYRQNPDPAKRRHRV